jgi:ATP-dependent Clp protease ATP-binding subunit ClpC
MSQPEDTDSPGSQRLAFLFTDGRPEAPWDDASPGGALHRLLQLIGGIAHAQLIHERVIDEPVAAAFQATLREPSVPVSAQWIEALLVARKVRAAELLGMVPPDSSRAQQVSEEMLELLRALRADASLRMETGDSIDAAELQPAGLLGNFIERHLEAEVLVAPPSAGPMSLPSASRPGPVPPQGSVAHLLRRDGSRMPLYPFVLVREDGGLLLPWDLDAGRLRHLSAEGGAPVVTEPHHPEFLAEWLLRMGAWAELREFLRGLPVEARSGLSRQVLLCASAAHYGALYLRQREFAQASAELEKAARLRPDLLLPHLLLAQAWMAQKQFDRASELLKRHAVRFNRSDRLFEMLGDCARQRRDMAGALRMYEKAATLNPLNAQAGRKRDLLRDELRREREAAMAAQQQASVAASAGGAAAAVPATRLEDFLVDMTLEAELGNYQSTIGREDDIRQLIEILSCRDKRNPLILGEPGVGKTALVEDLVVRIVQRRVPPRLQGKKVWLMSVATLLAGAKYRGQFEERVLDLVKLLKGQDGIVFIDNVHNLVNAGLTRGGTLDASSLLKPFLLRGELQVIGATTHDEYRQNVEKDTSLLRCFQLVTLEEPSVELAADMCCHVRQRYETHHGVTLRPAVIRQCLPLIDACVRERALPDKALDVLDRACAVAAMRRAAGIEAGGGVARGSDVTLTRDDVLAVLSEMSRIPVSRLTEDERTRLLRLEEHLSRRVIGQPEAVTRVSRVLRAARLSLRLDARRPKGVFLFVGPSGVGKTELARAMAELLFGSEDRLVRIDMSEYMERISQSRLIGTAPGYVGYNDQNQLTDEVRKNPHSLVLLDEIEKASHEMINLFLQVFDAGRLTDGKGRTVHFDSATVVMTSNVGTHLFSRAAVGFEEGRGSRHASVTEADLLREVRRQFAPEFLNRIDEIICFEPLTDEDMRQITRQKVERLSHELERQGQRLELQPDAEDFLAEEGFSPDEGARNLERILRRLLLEPLAEHSLTSGWEGGGLIRVGARDGELTFDLIPDAAPAPDTHGEAEADLGDEPHEGEASEPTGP